MESRLIKILAIDDNPDNLITIQALVKEVYPKVAVIKALNGQQGLEIARAENPDVILLDIVMPDMDGYEVCRKLKADIDLCDIPVIFVTAIKGDKESRIKALECGAEAFLAKPIDESELTAQIRAMVKIKNAHIERNSENIRLAALVNEQTSELKKSYTATLNLLEDLKNENAARRKTEEALRASEEKFREMTNLLPQVVFELDNSGKITYVNEKSYTIFGYGEGELIGKLSLQVHVPEERKSVLEKFKLKLDGVEIDDKEFRMLRKDGSSFPALIYTNSAVKNDKIIGLRGIVIDITQQKLDEEKIRESEKKYRNIANLLPQVVFELDSEGKITYVNKQIETMFGYVEDEMIGKTSLMVHHQQDIERVINDLRSRLNVDHYKGVEYDMVRKDNTTFPALVYTDIIYSNNKPAGFRGLIVDITERKQAEEKITHIARLYAFLSQINQAIVRTQSKTELYQTICQVAVEFGQFHMAWVGMFDETDDRIKPTIWAGHNDGYLDQINIITGFEVHGQGPTGSAFREGEIKYSNDIAVDPKMLPWKDEALKRGYKSLIAVPIRRNGKTIGVLTLYATESDFFSEDELRLLKEIGEDINFAINVIDNENQRKQTEQALEQSRNELKTIYDFAPVMLCVVDIDKRVLFANQAFSVFTGFSEEKMKGSFVGGAVGCINSIDDPRGCGYGPNCVKCPLRTAMESTFITGKGVQNIEYQTTLVVEGINREFSLLGSTAIINNGETTNLLLSLHNITDRKLVEEALQKSEMLLRTFIDNIPFEIWARDNNQIGILENIKLNEHFGTIIGNIPKTSVKVDEKTVELWKINNKRVYNGELIDEEIEQVINNEIRIFQQIVFPIPINSKIIGIAGFNIDITDRKKIERELIEQKRFFEQMFMQSTLSTQILDNEGWCERVNPKLSQIFGVEAKHIEGHVYNIFNDKEIVQKGIFPKLEKVFKQGKTADWEVLFDIGIAADSQNIDIIKKKKAWFSNWAYPIFDQNNKISHVIIQHNDITDRKMAEVALSKSQEQLKKFASHLQNVREEERVLLAREIHDELGQILIAIKIDMGMLKQNVLKRFDNKASEDLLAKFDNLVNLVDYTIKTARKIMTDLRPEVLDLLGFTEAVKQHLKAFEERYKITCNFVNSTKNIEMNSQHSVALFRIIQEALNNVAKHSKASEVKVVFIQDDNNLLLEIIDNGIGFDENHKKNNDSYGLIGMNERVFLLNGELTITGKKNVGTTIKVVMPYNLINN